MIIIPPLTITDTNLTSTNVTEMDETDWLTATPYSIDDVRQETTPNIHAVYVCVQAHTSDADNRPSVDVDSETGIGAFWTRVSATNPWAMFTDQISDQTENATSIEVTVVSAEVVNSVSLFNLEGTEVTIEVDDPTDGVVYDRTVDLQDQSAIIDWYQYYFSPIVTKRDITCLDLPPYSGADINITISAPAGTAKCGLAVIGYQKPLGVTNNGTSVGILDYSRKDLDTFGRPIIIQRNFSKRADYDVTVPTGLIDFVQNTLSDLRTTPVVWVGEASFGATIIYGYYRDFSIIYQNAVSSQSSIEVEGLT